MTTTANSMQPGTFRLPGYTIAVGPFTHVAAERDRLATLQWRHFDARQLGATVGAEITGVDLAAALPDGVVAELRQALHDYKVVFFRDQALTPRQHVAFARRFGDLEVHPFLPSNTGEPELVRFEKSAEVSGYENSWHHDVTWRERPSMGAILHAVSVPDNGGDTLFSDMYAAYDGLDQATKDEIDQLQAVHDFTQTFGPGAVPAGPPSRGVFPPHHRQVASLRQPSLRESHRGAGPGVQPGLARPPVPAGRCPRAPVPLHLDQRRGCVLG
jgi:hypothetical protein